MNRPIAIFVLGPSALPVAVKIKDAVGGVIQGPTTFNGIDVPFDNARYAIARAFQSSTLVIGVCASGILIRAVAAHLGDKHAEPPVIAVAEDGSSVVPLLGGHHGGNDLSLKIAAALKGHSAITTASDVMLGDAVMKPEGSVLGNPSDYKSAVAAKLQGQPIIFETTINRHAGGAKTLVYHPLVLGVGVGCERGTDPLEVKQLLEEVLTQHNLAPQAIFQYASIDVKADEPAVNQFHPVYFFTAEQLRSESSRISNPSDIVEKEVGTPSVAEAAALAVVGPTGKLLVAKTKSKRATVAIAQAQSQASFQHGGQLRGSIAVVGIGPGSGGTMTPDVDFALWKATEWVGYSLYLDLVENRRTTQTRHDFQLGDEEARCRVAIALASQGKQVALVCSGDAGIYAMAALVFELTDREPSRISIDVHPGVSAFQMASAKAGAMIGHDFCCISLSDLLTPWEVIEQRITAAAQGDFVISFYNPRSLKRRDQLKKAFAILSPHRPTDTPVIIAANLGREAEAVKIVSFADFNPDDVDMLTLVMVGSSQSKSFMRGDGKTYAYTPRGYARKMDQK